MSSEHDVSPRTRLAADNLCSIAAAARAEDPIGSGLFTTRALAVEVPPPWSTSFYRADPEGNLRERTAAMLSTYYERLQATAPAGGLFVDGYVGVFAIAPDREWSTPGLTRVLMVTRPEGPFRAFEVAEYHFPVESERILDLVSAFLEGDGDYASVEVYRVPHGGQRELFVCTHGQVDICCGTFGFPLYTEARRLEGARVWRASHFGGHRYAPTAWELPSGYTWGFLDESSTHAVMSRRGDTRALGPKMRGTAGLEPHVQLLDRVGFEEFGWAWLDFERSGTAEQVAPEERRWRVRLAYRGPGGETGRYEGEVDVLRDLPALGCGTESEDSTHTVPEYRLLTVTHDRGVAFPVLATF